MPQSAPTRDSCELSGLRTASRVSSSPSCFLRFRLRLENQRRLVLSRHPLRRTVVLHEIRIFMRRRAIALIGLDPEPRYVQRRQKSVALPKERRSAALEHSISDFLFPAP